MVAWIFVFEVFESSSPFKRLLPTFSLDECLTTNEIFEVLVARLILLLVLNRLCHDVSQFGAIEVCTCVCEDIFRTVVENFADKHSNKAHKFGVLPKVELVLDAQFQLFLVNFGFLGEQNSWQTNQVMIVSKFVLRWLVFFVKLLALVHRFALACTQMLGLLSGRPVAFLIGSRTLTLPFILLGCFLPRFGVLIFSRGFFLLFFRSLLLFGGLFFLLRGGFFLGQLCFLLNLVLLLLLRCGSIGFCGLVFGFGLRSSFSFFYHVLGWLITHY